MSLGLSVTKLHDALEALQGRWEMTQTLWADNVRQDFEEEFVAPIPHEVRSTLEAMERLATVLHRLRHECS
jgi:hypothetical protein